ncbi:unnamed protein product [[Actinomadura] parvosata subsp. kistnae]|uniref:hypothetical protein n=1 Tax=[Actinomadura] parvosata TaxID=1955412 RepID=UPI000D2ABCF2|nr:unnamed protein product [Actinomadura parvosata subsp. kistnae]
MLLRHPLARLILLAVIFVALEVPFALTGVLWGSWSGAAVLNFGAILVALYVVTRFVERRPWPRSGSAGGTPYGTCSRGRR